MSRRSVVLPGVLYTKWNAEPRRGVAIVVDEGRIQSVIDAERADLSTFDGEVIDAADLTVLPGMVDMHLHITTRGAGRLHEERAKSFDDYLRQGASNLTNALGWGVTTVRDAGSDGRAVLALRDRIRARELLGPRVSACGSPITSPGGHLYWLGGEAEGIPGIRAQVRDHFREGFDHVKVMVSGGWATPQSDPRRTQFDDGELATLTGEARSLGLHTMGHAACTAAVRQCLKAGVDTIEHCMFQRGDGSWEYPAALASAIVAGGTWVNPTPAWHYRTVSEPPAGVPAAWIEELRRTREARLDTYRRLVADGHDRWLVGTDTGGTNPQDYYPLVCQIMVEEVGLSPRDVIRAATASAAEVLGLDREIGDVEPGFAADLVAVRGDPFADIRALWGVEWTMVGGQQYSAPRDRVFDQSAGGGPQPVKV